MINEPTKSFLDDYFKKTAARQDVQIVDVEILRTHVHMVVRTPPRIDLPRLVQFFKGGSSHAASRLPGNVLGLRWAPSIPQPASVPASSTRCVNTCDVKQITIPVKVSFRTMSAEHTL